MSTQERINHSANRLIWLILILIGLGFGLLSIRDGVFDYDALLCGGVLAVLLGLSYLILRSICKRFDRLMFIVVALLIAIGMIMQYRLDPQNAIRQMLFLLIGMAAGLICLKLIGIHDKLRRGLPLLILFSLGLLLSLLFIGREEGGATNWLIIAGISFQPSEFVKITLVLVLAHYFDRYSGLSGFLIPVGFSMLCAVLLVLQRDLGAAVLFVITTLIVYFAATGNKSVTALGMALGAGGAVIGYKLFDHVRIRVAAWRNPWASYETNGYQIAQGLMAMASGGLFGIGLGLGSPKSIPAYSTDYIFASICEELGILVGLCIIALYIAFVIRGLLIALRAPCRFLTLLALGCTLIIALQSFIIIGGNIKFIPLTGITLPFVSYGGSSIISCMILFGILQGIASHSILDTEFEVDSSTDENECDAMDDELPDDEPLDYDEFFEEDE